MLESAGFEDVRIGPAVDTFGGAGGEANARAFAVYGYAFVARRGATGPRTSADAVTGVVR